MSSHRVACGSVRSFTRSVSGGVGHFNGARRRTGQSAYPMVSAISMRGSTVSNMRACAASFTACHDVAVHDCMRAKFPVLRASDLGCTFELECVIGLF